MRKNDFDFSIPIRQSKVAIAILIYKTFKIIVRQLWPVLLIFLIGRGGTEKNYLVIFISVVAIVSLVLSIIGYFRFYFHIKGDELIVHKGVINRKVLNISFDRIQTVNFEQNLIQQVFNVVGLKVDTAGSAKDEFSFDALDRDMAVALRETILSAKKESVLEENSITEQSSEQEFSPILELGVLDLIKIGASQNHFKSFGLIMLFFFWIYDNLQDAGINAEEYTESYLPEMSQALATVVIMAVILSVVSFLISLINTVFRYFDLKLLRGDRGFKIISGLFNRKEVAAMDHKIQMIQWGDNPLKRFFGMKDLQFKQASSVEVNSNKSIKVVGCYNEQIEEVKRHYFRSGAFDGLQGKGIDYRYLIRRIIFVGGIPALMLVTIAYFNIEQRWVLLGIAGLWLIWIILSSIVKFKKYRYDFNQWVMLVKKGMFGDYESLLKLIKVQNIKIQQTLYQKRNDLADIEFYTASGSATIPFIPHQDAKDIRDYILYKVETSKERWM